ncbi:MAG: DUF3817 domain-containing protein [Myxococcales bacterium FL481]|nr:MAG: DUF3817 domain-containing protein [Myxococcales bacterium FL481]
MLNHSVGRLRVVGMLEGLSFIVLLGIAMPLKYLAGQPLAVRVVGMTHGVLFIAYCVVLAHAWSDRGWSLRRAAWLFVASLIPFGTFVADRQLRHETEPQPREPDREGSAARPPL